MSAWLVPSQRFSTHDDPMWPMSRAKRLVAAYLFERDDLSDGEWDRPVGLLVGEQPRPAGNPELPLWPHPPMGSGGRLFEMSKMDMLEYFQLLARVNVSYKPVARWSANRARERGLALIERASVGDRIVACGSRARDALGIAEFFRLTVIPGLNANIEAVAIPHPSGRNPAYNDRDNVKLASSWIRWAARLR